MRTLVAVTALLILLVSCQTDRRARSVRDEVAAPPDTVAEASLAPLDPEAAGEGIAAVLPFPTEVPTLRPALEVHLDALLEAMTLRQKIGQRFMTAFPGQRPGDRVLKLVREGQVGGLLVTRSNVQSREQIKALTAALQAAAGENLPAIGLFVAVDQEGGRVSRLELDNVTRFAAPHYWSEYRDPRYVESIAYIAGKEALALGLNMNLAPVLDLYGLADNSVIGDRSMGPNPFVVGEQGVFYLHGARRAGIAAVVKHFPGHGATAVDSHRELPVVDADEQQLWQRDLIPFQLAIDHDVEAVMTAHLLLPKLDPEYPVTLSEVIIRGLLRERLGFKGLVITDDIDMGALRKNFTPRQILMYSIRAGVDLILCTGGLDALQLIGEVESLVEGGALPEELIDEGVRRILRLKFKYGLLPAPPEEEQP